MLKNKDGYLTIESALVIPVILIMIMGLTFLLYKISNHDALVVIRDYEDLVQIIEEEPKISLFYKIRFSNELGEIIHQKDETQPKGSP